MESSNNDCSAVYDTSIDIWGMACVTAELFNLNPLFAGDDQMSQLKEIFLLLGTPSTHVGWPELKPGILVSCGFQELPAQPLSDRIPTASTQALDLISQIFQYNPTLRPSASTCLSNNWFKVWTFLF